MLRKRRRKTSISKSILFVCSIVVLNMAGISYAYWNSGLNITTLVSTGDLDVQFDPNTTYELVNGKGNLTLRFEDARTILVEGTVEEAVGESKEETGEATIISPVYSDYEGLIKLNIINGGNIPAELVNKNLNVETGKVEIGPDNQQGLLYPVNSVPDSNISPEIKIQASEGSIDFGAEFLFNQPE